MSQQKMPKPSEVDCKLRVGIFKLLTEKYKQKHGDRTKFICAAIMNLALLEPAGNDEAQLFLEDNHSVIEDEARKLCDDPKLSLAFAILYCFTLIRIGPK